jgi:hypothetical protein
MEHVSGTVSVCGQRLAWVGCCVTPRLSKPQSHHHSWCRVEVSRSHLGLTLTSTSHTLRKGLSPLSHKLSHTSLTHLSRISLASLSHISLLSVPLSVRSAILNPQPRVVSTPTPLILLTPLIPALSANGGDPADTDATIADTASAPDKPPPSRVYRRITSPTRFSSAKTKACGSSCGRFRSSGGRAT